MAYNNPMDPSTAQKILDINYQFYQSFAADFSETRGRLQPGVLRILDCLESEISILDLGCGNGQLACYLGEEGFKGNYLGTDFSPALLEDARRRNQANPWAKFVLLDIAGIDWSDALPDTSFEAIFCFAALHHIPSRDLRTNVIRNIRCWLDDQGQVFLSSWQFLKSNRYRERLLPWELVGLDKEEVDQGDYLLDWRRGGTGIRYVHHFSGPELSDLAAEGGFNVVDSFESDGKEGQLGFYQVWEPC